VFRGESRVGLAMSKRQPGYDCDTPRS
jgi:hypothetical protein